MSLSFPSSPALNETTIINGVSWMWNGTAWTKGLIVGLTGSLGYTGSVGAGYTGSSGSAGEIGYTGSVGPGMTQGKTIALAMLFGG